MSVTNHSQGSARALIPAIRMTVLVVAVGGFLAAFDGSRNRPSIDELQHRNGALRSQQETLRDRAFDLTERSAEAVKDGQRMLRILGAHGRDWEAESLPLPARDANTETLLAWLSAERAVLAGLDKELQARQAAIDGGARFTTTTTLYIPRGQPDRGPARRKKASPIR